MAASMPNQSRPVNVSSSSKLAPMIAKIGGRLALLVLMVTTIGCDRVTKHVAEATLAGEPHRSFFADTIRLQYAENTGGFLSVGAELPAIARTGLFTIGTGLMLVGLAVAAYRLRWTGLPLLGLSLFFAGGASNWADRVARGSVVDFINVGVGPLRTGIFNVADVAILAGVAILVVTELRTRE
jgi:signal peptidase II